MCVGRMSGGNWLSGWSKLRREDTSGHLVDVGLPEKATGRKWKMQGTSPTHSCQIISLLKEDEIDLKVQMALWFCLHRKHLSCFLKVLKQIPTEHTARGPGILQV